MTNIVRLTFLSLMVTCFQAGNGYGQQSVVSAGGDFTGAGGTMSISTGLTDFYYYGSPNGSLQFGMQHAFYDSTPGDIPDELDVPDTSLADEDRQCFNALQTITTGGHGNTFLVEASAVAELIAGKNIRMLAGTSVVAGGYLHARITTDGSFCDPDKHLLTMAPLAATAGKLEDTIQLAFDEVFDSLKKESLFKVYPNPTTGMFTLELHANYIETEQEMTVEIYAMRGERVVSERVATDHSHVFSLADRQPGMYIVRVVHGHQTSIGRIIKK